MKILVVSDIHSDYIAAESAAITEKPDLVLDCGDHNEIKNFFGTAPHLFIYGNHEPLNFSLPLDGLPFPVKIPSGCVVTVKDKNYDVRIAGIDGNYSNITNPFSLKESDIELLGKIPDESVDIFLTHESPLLLKSDSNYYGLAQRVIEEIDRIQPKMFFSGHLGKYMDLIKTSQGMQRLKTPGGVQNIILDDLKKGYCLVDGETYRITRKMVRFR